MLIYSFPSSVSILITDALKALNNLPVICFPQLVLSIEANFLGSSFFLTEKQLPIPVLKGCPCVEAFVCSLHWLSGFGGRARYEVSTGHIFQGVWVAIPLVRVGAEMRTVRARCELEILQCSAVVTPLLGVRSEKILFPPSVLSPLP